MDQPLERSGINLVDLVSGLFMFAVCAAFAWIAWGYDLGTPARMGAGFFPFWFGIIGMGLAATIMARALVTPGGLLEAPHGRALVLIAISIVAFGLLIESLGLGPAVVAAAFISAFADRETTLKEALVLALVLAAGIWVIFVYLLGLNMPLIAGLR